MESRSANPKRVFYRIFVRPDGLADIYLFPFSEDIRAIYGVAPWKGMEDDIRARYAAWCAEAKSITAGGDELR